MTDSKTTKPKKSAVDSTPISLIEDPFSINTLEIAEAQRDAEELSLDEDLEDFDEPEEGEDAKTLAKLSAAIAENDKLQAAQAETILREGLSPLEAAEALAREIAEDQALQKTLAEEATQAEALEVNDIELQAALPQAENLDVTELQSCVEALLFMADQPISAEKLRELLGPGFKLSAFQEALTELCDRYRSAHHGIELVKVAGGYQFRTKPGRAALARKLARTQAQRLSSGAMECLAITAYKQPVMKEDIDKIRGVDSSYFIRGLLDKKLIRIAGRSELPGRPMLYATTQDFLEIFGLADLSAMPPLPELENMIPSSQALQEDPRVIEMRKLVSQMTTDTSTTLCYDPKEDEKLLQEIRERVSAIPTSTPTLDARDEAADQPAQQPSSQLSGDNAQPELPPSLG